MHLQFQPIGNRNIVTITLTLLILTLSGALSASCGGGWGEGGDPLGIVAEDAYELEIYIPATYLDQHLPDELRERFETTREDFNRFGIELNDMNRFVSVVVDCCDFERSGLAGGARLYIIDGPIDSGAVKGKLESEGFESRMSGEYELWQRWGLQERFRFFNNLSVAFLADEGYLLIGSDEGVMETLFELGRGQSQNGESAIEQLLDRIGDAWEETGRLDAQTLNNFNTHCAHDVRYDRSCEATAHYTSYGEEPLKTVMVSLYGTPEDAEAEADRLEHNMEEKDQYSPLDVEVIYTEIDGSFVEATVLHDKPLQRRYSRVY